MMNNLEKEMEKYLNRTLKVTTKMFITPIRKQITYDAVMGHLNILAPLLYSAAIISIPFATVYEVCSTIPQKEKTHVERAILNLSPIQFNQTNVYLNFK